MVIPKYIISKSKVAITCSSGELHLTEITQAIEVFKFWEWELIVGETLRESKNYFSHEDAFRLQELQNFLDNPSIQAIYFGRGGYGLTRIIDKINWDSFIKKPKWLIGFSDVTLLLCSVYSQFNIVSLHAPMCRAFKNYNKNKEYLNRIHESLKGEKLNFSTSSSLSYKKGIAQGKLVGGNLAMFVHTLGTTSEVDTNSCILFLEDVGEYLYNIDRMLWQLKRADKFSHVSGIILGGFTELKDTQKPFGKNIVELLKDFFSEYNFPICLNFPIGHQEENLPLKYGKEHSLEVKDDMIILKEI